MLDYAYVTVRDSGELCGQSIDWSSRDSVIDG